jgi:FAD/FMN-containing dehydrogenase/Fe-S oxidoreductase
MTQPNHSDPDPLTSLHADLRRALTGEVKFDWLTRQLYSTDASNYRQVPQGVILPRHADEVAAAVEIAGRYQAAITPRGSGSSLSGQAIGPGLVLDYSRHFTRVLDLNPAERRVRVEAGVVLGQLNAALTAHGLMVGPDPASAAVATLGGMTANNSTGSHSLKYRMMVDHVQAVTVILADGRRAEFGPKSPAEVAALAGQSTLEGQLYREIPRLLTEYQADIAAGYPRTWRNVAGYNLNRLLADGEAGRPFNLAPLLVGSEGTLAQIIDITLGLVARPRHTRLLVLHFDDLTAALDSVPLLLAHDPAAIELMGQYFIRIVRGHARFGADVRRFIDGDPAAVLIVEFAGDEPGRLAEQAGQMTADLARTGYRGAIVPCLTPDDIANVWTIRRESFGLVMSRPGDAKPLAFVDDAAVPLAELSAYAAEVERACREAGAEVTFDSHASAGCLHLNPVINLKTAAGLGQMETISRAVMAIAMRHHGTTTGEHGEGLARSYYNEQLYGPRLHQAFRQVKALFDPHNRLNPGKIIDGPAPWQPELLRLNPAYRTPQQPSTTWLDFSEYGGMAGLVEMCNGQGLCRAGDAGTMCPSFRATHDETHSTRGRANALRAAMTGALGPDGFTGPELHAALDLCLECKACKTECSSLVDMAKLKYEFLAHYQAKHGVPWRSRLFAHVATLNRWGSRVPALTNRLYRQPALRRLMERVLGIDRRRPLPALAATTFQRWFNARPPVEGRRGPVVLWDDTYLSYNAPEIGQAAVRVLEAAGFSVQLIAERRCCGRPMISKGLLTEARQNAAHNVARLAPFAAAGVPIIGLEPSCLATFRDEYPDLLGSEEARLVARHSFFIEEFLLDLAEQGELELTWADNSSSREILLHGHCYQKALGRPAATAQLLRQLPHATVAEIPSGCCGMAGAFGFEREHYDLSLAIGEERLFPAIRAASPETVLAAAGTSCRQQIWDGGGRRAVHPIEIVAGALAD